MQPKTRYDQALDYLAHHFQRNTLSLAPPLGELPADLVEIREGPGLGEQHCVVCEWVISGPQPLPGQRPAQFEYVYQSGRTVSFHGDCHEAWLSKSVEWRREHP